MARSRVVRTAVSLTALTLVAAGGAWALDRGGPGGAPGAGQGGTTSPRVGLASYRSFTGCDDLLAHLRTQALPQVGPFGLDSPVSRFGAVEVADLLRHVGLVDAGDLHVRSGVRGRAE